MVFLAVLANLMVTGCAHVPPAPQPLGSADAAAVNRVLPTDAVVDVKKEFGVAGNGVSDDTGPIQAAIAASLGYGNPRKVLFFPAGTYLVSRPLLWQLTGGQWSTWLTLQGENRDRTVLKLVDHADGFQDPAEPRSMIVTGSQNADGPDGAGNQAFFNFIFDMTIDVGIGNPGANGVDFLASNRGAMRNVVVRAPANSGNIGVSMTRKWAGPALLEDLQVVGFSRGIVLTQSEYSMVAERVRLSGQRLVGIDNQNNVLSIRGLVSDNSVTAVRNGTLQAQSGLVTILDSTLRGAGSELPAVENFGAVFMRGVSTPGYGAALRDRGHDVEMPADGELVSPAGPGRPGSSLRLPVMEAPTSPNYPLDLWVAAEQYGAVPDDGRDDTAAIQAALDSGKPIVYLRAGRYLVSSTMRVPGTVRMVEGFDAVVDGKRGMNLHGESSPIFSVSESDDAPLIFDKLFFDISQTTVAVERGSTRTLSFRDIHFSGFPFVGGPGQIFLSDVEGGWGWRFTRGQQIWARQFNSEQKDLNIVNDGAQLWILGLKTEGPGTAITSTNGARTELLGGLLYPVRPTVADKPAFVTDSSSAASLTFGTSANDAGRNYNLLSRNGELVVTSGQVPGRGKGSLVSRLVLGGAAQ